MIVTWTDFLMGVIFQLMSEKVLAKTLSRQNAPLDADECMPGCVYE